MLASCTNEDVTVTETITLETFARVVVESDFAVELVASERFALDIAGPEESVAAVTYEVEQGVLRLVYTEGWRWLSPKRSALALTLYAPPLEQVLLQDGASLVATTPISSRDFGVVFAGKSCEADLVLAGGLFYYWNNSSAAGRLTLRGSTDRLNLYNFGLTSIAAEGLTARKSDVINGSRADVVLRVTDTLNFTIEGKGNIDLYGRPVEVVSKPLSGEGRLRRL